MPVIPEPENPTSVEESLKPFEDSDTEDSKPRVAWIRGLRALLPAIVRDKRSREVMVVLRELKVRGAAYGILPTGGAEELEWKNSQQEKHTLKKKTVSNEILRAFKALKAAGLIPD